MRTGRRMQSLCLGKMVPAMIDRSAQSRFGEIAHKWRTLVEKRRDHAVELHMSGRWSAYYGEQAFKRYMRDAADAVERWAQIAPRQSTDGEPKSKTAQTKKLGGNGW